MTRLVHWIRRRRNSLYARAALFLALGSASLVGAMAVLAHASVEDAVERILAERIALARAVGILLQSRVGAELDRLERTAARPLATGDREAVRAALAHEYPSTAFEDGTFVLDARGRWVTGVPASVGWLADATDLGTLREEVDAGRRTGVSPLVGLESPHAPILVFLRRVTGPDGRVLGYLGAALAPGRTNLLDALLAQPRSGHTEVDVVDRLGRVIASTNPAVVFRRDDHGQALVRAIDQGHEIQGECHQCHRPADARDVEPPRAAITPEVLAFAPLPGVALGVAVHQPRAEALAPAFLLRRRLFLLGTAFVGLFLVFAGLSVRSVVEPVTRLTDAVGRLEEAKGRARLPRFGRDEVGHLAAAMDLWRGRMVDSLEAAESHRAALRTEIELTRRHLMALERVATEAMGDRAPGEVLQLGLDEMLSLLGLRRGALRVEAGGRTWLAARGLEVRVANRLLDRCEVDLPAGAHEHDSGFGVCRHGRLPLHAWEEPAPPTRLGAYHVIPDDFVITALLECDLDRVDLDERWLQSLNHHVAIVVMSRILAEREHEQKAQQAQLLHRVLKAQEDERRRVARELHDTVAQDLAALRLELERLGGRREAHAVAASLSQVERRTAETLAAVRRTLLDLRLSVLENMGFLPTLQWHLERVERDYGVRGILTVDGEERELPYETSVILFRIFQESLSNVVQHAGAEHVSVTVGFEDDEVELVVEDDGHGFDPAEVGARRPSDGGRGLGLLGMEERARLLGGRARVEARPGEGTTVTVRVPIHPSPAPWLGEVEGL